MKMGNLYPRRPFFNVYVILYGLSILQLVFAALGDATTPSLEVTLVSATYSNGQYVDNPMPEAYDGHFGSAKLLDRSMAPPKSGISGYLFEITMNCSNITNITMFPIDSNLIPLQRIAFISNSSCYMDGLNAARKLNVTGVIIVADQDDQSPTLPENVTFGFTIFAVSSQDGSALGDAVNEYNNPLLGNGTTNRLKAIMSYSSGFFPGVWEFTLIIVVVLLAISFATSVAMHCHLYRIRRRQRRQRDQRGLIGYVGAKKNLTLSTEMLEKFPVRTYKASSVSNHFDASSKQNEDEIKDNSLRMQEISENDEHVPTDFEADASTVDLSSSPVSADDKNPSLMRNKSTSSTHSKKEGMHSRHVSIRSVRSTRSTKSARLANAVASASTLAANTGSNITASDQSYNNTCAVCLEDFDEGDQLRTLPCGHEYHTECIDPWLTQKSSLCPLCKHDCIPKTENEEVLETLPDERNIYVGALLTWGPIAYCRNIFQKIRGRSSNNAETAQLGSNTNSDHGTNESPIPLTNVGVRQHNTSTSALSRIQTNNSSHSVSQQSSSSGIQSETILREIAIAGHMC